MTVLRVRWVPHGKLMAISASETATDKRRKTAIGHVLNTTQPADWLELANRLQPPRSKLPAWKTHCGRTLFLLTERLPHQEQVRVCRRCQASLSWYHYGVEVTFHPALGGD